MRQEKPAVIVLSVVVFLVLMGLTLITPALPFYDREFGATATMVELPIILSRQADQRGKVPDLHGGCK